MLIATTRGDAAGDQGAVVVGERLRTVEHDQRKRRDGLRLAGARDAFDLDRIGRVAQTGGVDQRHRNAVEIDALGQRVAGGAGNLGHDRPRGAEQGVEQTGFSGVRPADNHDHPAFADDAAGARLTEQSSEARGNRVEFAAGLVAGEEVKTFLGEIERRFEPRRQIEQRGIRRGDLAGQRALQLIHRRLRLNQRHRIDEITDRFGLHEIEPAVEIRAQRELAGLRQRAPADIAASTMRCSSSGLP